MNYKVLGLIYIHVITLLLSRETHSGHIVNKTTKFLRKIRTLICCQNGFHRFQQPVSSDA